MNDLERTILRTSSLVLLLTGCATTTFTSIWKAPDAKPLQFRAGDKVVALVHRGKGRYKLSADFQLSFQPESRDWDGLVAETKAVLQELRAAC